LQLENSLQFEPSIIVCSEDNGQISVNLELWVASGFCGWIHRKRPKLISTGNSSIAGEGVTAGTNAGPVTAINKSKQFLSCHGFSACDDTIHSFAASLLPVWRSDIAAYSGQSQLIQSALFSLGIQVLCVGQCDSERLVTGACWWYHRHIQNTYRQK
jgi:hypothetical protein